jgi:gamma-glutamyltranspeptidase/glutathione hydrolase
MSRCRFGIVGCGSALLLALAAAAPVEATESGPAWSAGGMVASSAGPAVGPGREVLARGGNAIDAAVATGFAAGCAHPFSSGIGGGGFLVIRIASSGEVFALDARETAPAAARIDMYVGVDGKVDPEASRTGGLAVAVPSLVQGLEAAHRRFGKLPWAEVIEPAARLCREGVTIAPYHRQVSTTAARKLLKFPETARIQLDGGRPRALGSKLVQADLAATYDRIAKDGAEAMRSGPIARAMVDAARASGGILALEDLRAYEPKWREPVRGEYRGLAVFGMPPPSSGGALIIEMLNALESAPLRELGSNSSDTIHRVAEVMKVAFADRAAHMGDPEFFQVPLAWLTSKARAKQIEAQLAPPPFWKRPPWKWGEPSVLKLDRPATPPPQDSGTTHISVLDAEGNAVSLTQTVNTLYGSGVTAAPTGILLNNEMDDFAVAPGTPNAFGLVGDRANAVEPGKRPLSSMSPTIVVRDGKAWIVSGSPQGPYIITAVLQTLLNVIDFDMDVQSAVAAPRFHHQWRPDELQLELEHPQDVVDRLAKIGHPIARRQGGFGASTTILRDPASGIFYGAMDPRRETAAAGP